MKPADRRRLEMNIDQLASRLSINELSQQLRNDNIFSESDLELVMTGRVESLLRLLIDKGPNAYKALREHLIKTDNIQTVTMLDDTDMSDLTAQGGSRRHHRSVLLRFTMSCCWRK